MNTTGFETSGNAILSVTDPADRFGVTLCLTTGREALHRGDTDVAGAMLDEAATRAQHDQRRDAPHPPPAPSGREPVMTTPRPARRDSRPTWIWWWLGVIITAAWPLIAFAHYGNGQPGQLTTTGWIAETIWLAILTAIGISVTIARRHTDPLGAASKHNPGVTRGQGAERHPRRTDTPAPPA